jgi:hypothetical protein
VRFFGHLLGVGLAGGIGGGGGRKPRGVRRNAEEGEDAESCWPACC